MFVLWSEINNFCDIFFFEIFYIIFLIRELNLCLILLIELDYGMYKFFLLIIIGVRIDICIVVEMNIKEVSV